MEHMPLRYWVIGIIVIVLGAIYKHRWYTEHCPKPFDSLSPDEKKARMAKAAVCGVFVVGIFLIATWKFFNQ